MWCLLCQRFDKTRTSSFFRKTVNFRMNNMFFSKTGLNLFHLNLRSKSSKWVRVHSSSVCQTCDWHVIQPTHFHKPSDCQIQNTCVSMEMSHSHATNRQCRLNLLNEVTTAEGLMYNMCHNIQAHMTLESLAIDPQTKLLWHFLSFCVLVFVLVVLFNIKLLLIATSLKALVC